MPSLARNKYAHHSFDFIEEYEGGLVLTGAEVKAAKKGHIQLKGSYVTLDAGELWVRNMHIGKYLPAGEQTHYNPTRTRKVLMHRSELRKIAHKKQAQGLTLVPISVYTKRDLVKISFALARGKAQHEKRDSIKKRDIDRRMREEVKKIIKRN
ncbi:MAG: SsrA-binding protein SmpB [bacterium]|nr:SsrA-binding protein SmpB [bacterium]MDA1024681.1 SsrA-binding protein SmpB [bacterium]